MKTKSMKTEFNVPIDVMVEFAEILAEKELTNEILGTSDDGEIIIEVHFEKAEFDAVQELTDLVELDEDEEEVDEE